ncbi:hypothetical protein D6D27_04494 [Aureobasidium pullulans]|nr:hypothetical protein D6D27_04494 [Aureobasidium pullulans]
MVIELQHMVAPSFWYRKSLCINKKLLSQAICPPYLHGLIPQCTHKIQGCDTPLQVFRSQVRYYNRIKRELVSIFTPGNSGPITPYKILLDIHPRINGRV